MSSPSSVGSNTSPSFSSSLPDDSFGSATPSAATSYSQGHQFTPTPSSLSTVPSPSLNSDSEEGYESLEGRAKPLDPSSQQQEPSRHIEIAKKVRFRREHFNINEGKDSVEQIENYISNQGQDTKISTQNFIGTVIEDIKKKFPGAEIKLDQKLTEGKDGVEISTYSSKKDLTKSYFKLEGHYTFTVTTKDKETHTFSYQRTIYTNTQSDKDPKTAIELAHAYQKLVVDCALPEKAQNKKKENFAYKADLDDQTLTLRVFVFKKTDEGYDIKARNKDIKSDAALKNWNPKLRLNKEKPLLDAWTGEKIKKNEKSEFKKINTLTTESKRSDLVNKKRIKINYNQIYDVTDEKTVSDKDVLRLRSLHENKLEELKALQYKTSGGRLTRLGQRLNLLKKPESISTEEFKTDLLLLDAMRRKNKTDDNEISKASPQMRELIEKRKECIGKLTEKAKEIERTLTSSSSDPSAATSFENVDHLSPEEYAKQVQNKAKNLNVTEDIQTNLEEVMNKILEDYLTIIEPIEEKIQEFHQKYKEEFVKANELLDEIDEIENQINVIRNKIYELDKETKNDNVNALEKAIEGFQTLAEVIEGDEETFAIAKEVIELRNTIRGENHPNELIISDHQIDIND